MKVRLNQTIITPVPMVILCMNWCRLLAALATEN